MKIKVSDLKANPYRRIDQYPIDRAKVEALKISINETGFWDNILVRKSATGGYELAYGHHRLTAIRELEIETIDVPVKPIPDADMLRIMAGENMDVYKAVPSIINETVQVTKEFIDGELAKYKTWEECNEKAAIFSNLFNSLAEDSGKNPKALFGQAKGQGAGRNIICAFLGGNWKPWMVENALTTLKSQTVDREAVEVFDKYEPARVFAGHVQRYNIPKEEQKPLAERLVKDDRASKREMGKAISEYIGEGRKEREMVVLGDSETEDERWLKSIQSRAKRVKAAVCSAANEIQDAVNFFNEHGVTEVGGIEGSELSLAIKDLLKTVSNIAPMVSIGSLEETENA